MKITYNVHLRHNAQKPKLRKTQKDIYNTPSYVFSFYFFSTGSHFISLTFKSMKVYTTKTAEAAAGFTWLLKQILWKISFVVVHFKQESYTRRKKLEFIFWRYPLHLALNIKATLITIEIIYHLSGIFVNNLTIALQLRKFTNSKQVI